MSEQECEAEYVRLKDRERKGEEQVLSGICNELKHEAVEEFCVLDAEIQANGDALSEE